MIIEGAYTKLVRETLRSEFARSYMVARLPHAKIIRWYKRLVLMFITPVAYIEDGYVVIFKRWRGCTYIMDFFRLAEP